MTARTFGRYAIKSELGRGGMATVFHAYDPRVERDVAVKVLPREFLHDRAFRARFEREAKVIAALEHPAIVPVHDFGEQDGQPYIVMRFMTGGPLTARIEKGPLSIAEATSVLQRIGAALDHAHRQGVVHRDLKPDNILFDQFGDAYLSDFGIAKVTAATANLTGASIIGTPAYMSPEQVQGAEEIDGRSDIYALGIILFELLTAATPYEADTPMGVAVKHLTEPVPRILDVKPDLPSDCEAVINRALAKDPAERYATAGELAAALAAIASRVMPATSPAHAETVAVPASSARQSSPRRASATNWKPTPARMGGAAVAAFPGPATVLAKLPIAVAFAGLIAAVGGTTSDVFRPLGNLALWFGLLSLGLASAVLILLRRQQRQQQHLDWNSPVSQAFVLQAAIALLFGFWSLASAVGPERGYLAHSIAAVAQMQAQIFDFDTDIQTIKDTTTDTATQVAVVATAQADGFAALQASFAALHAGQAIVADPTTPQEWYSNARLYQLRGDTSNAIRAYEGYFEFGLEHVDPYHEYVALLKATEGIARAREVIGAMLAARPDSRSLELMHARLLDSPEERLVRLNLLAGRAPLYGPVFLSLGQEYDRALAANVTSNLLSQQQAAYNALFELETEQHFSRYYIDKSLAESQLQDARTMVEAYAAAATAFAAADVDIYYFYNGVQFSVVLPEIYNARQLLFSVDDPHPSTDSGKLGAGGQTFVNTSIGPLMLEVGEHTFYYQYVDANGELSEVFSKPFRVESIAVNFFQEPPDFSSNTIPGTFLLGVVGTQGYESYVYRYSIDSDVLDQEQTGTAVFSLAVDGLAPGEHVLFVQATAADGTATDLVKFPFTVN